MSLERQQSLDLLANDLEALLLGEVDFAETFKAGIPKVLHPDCYAVLCNVGHFLSDQDIRHRDSDYKAMQESQMKKLILALRDGAPLNKLLAYNFL